MTGIHSYRGYASAGECNPFSNSMGRPRAGNGHPPRQHAVPGKGSSARQRLRLYLCPCSVAAGSRIGSLEGLRATGDFRELGGSRCHTQGPTACTAPGPRLSQGSWTSGSQPPYGIIDSLVQRQSPVSAASEVVVNVESNSFEFSIVESSSKAEAGIRDGSPGRQEPTAGPGLTCLKRRPVSEAGGVRQGQLW